MKKGCSIRSIARVGTLLEATIVKPHLTESGGRRAGTNVGLEANKLDTIMTTLRRGECYEKVESLSTKHALAS